MVQDSEIKINQRYKILKLMKHLLLIYIYFITKLKNLNTEKLKN